MCRREGVGFRGLFTFRQKCLISQGTSWESAHGHPVATGLTLSCTREFAGRGGQFANSKPWPLPRGNPPVSGVGPRCQRSFFFGYTTCGISVPQSGTKPALLPVNAQIPNHWTTREFLRSSILKRESSLLVSQIAFLCSTFHDIHFW